MTLPDIERITLQLHEAALRGSDALKAAFIAIPKSEFKAEVWLKHGASYKAIAAEHDPSRIELAAAAELCAAMGVEMKDCKLFKPNKQTLR